MSPVSKRIVNLKAVLISDNVSSDGYIENLSEDNICCTTTAKNLSPGTEFQIKFQPEAGEALNLNCKLTWSYETPPHGITHSVGMEIVDQPTQYKIFLENLQ